MAFKKKMMPKESVELVSLIDMIFILLVFFLVTSFVIRSDLSEKGLLMATPENERGRAQILLQFVNENEVFWLDENIRDQVKSIRDRNWYLSEAEKRDLVLNSLLRTNRFAYSELLDTLDNLLAKAGQDPSKEYYILIRCPNELPYYRVIDVISKLSESTFPNVKYGSVGGSLDDIKNCKSIRTGLETLPNGQQGRVIYVDF